MIDIKRLAVNEENLEQIVDLYHAVWKNEDPLIKQRIQKHSTYQGFKGVIALHRTGEVTGFSYGYVSLPGQYYNQLLSKEFKPDEKQKWLEDCFELVELAVHPSYRKQGIGKLLVSKLLEDAHTKTAVLTTQINNVPARRLYESLGWRSLKEPFFPNNQNDPYVIYGKQL